MRVALAAVLVSCRCKIDFDTLDRMMGRSTLCKVSRLQKRDTHFSLQIMLVLHLSKNAFAWSYVTHSRSQAVKRNLFQHSLHVWRTILKITLLSGVRTIFGSIRNCLSPGGPCLQQGNTQGRFSARELADPILKAMSSSILLN